MFTFKMLVRLDKNYSDPNEGLQLMEEISNPS